MEDTLEIAAAVVRAFLACGDDRRAEVLRLLEVRGQAESTGADRWAATESLVDVLFPDGGVDAGRLMAARHH